MAQERDRQSLSRDIEVIADRIAEGGQQARADELRVVAAHLRAKDAASGQGVDGPRSPRRPKAYVLGAALVLSWLAVVLLVVALVA
jgi:hypothetical protein